MNGHPGHPIEEAPKFFPPELWPKKPSSMSNNHHYFISYHVNDKPITWSGMIIEKKVTV